MADRQQLGSDPQQRVRYLRLIAGLFALAILAAAFTVAVVQIQSGVAAYLSGEAVWSRGQIKTVYYLEQYARTGNAETLKRARRWHDIPLGDLQARRAMENEPFDYTAAREGFLRGQFHPSDIPRVIVLFRFFSDAPYFRDAVRAWQDSDRQILELEEIADDLAREWQSEEPSSRRLGELREQLATASDKLGVQATTFRSAMTRLARMMPTILSLASIVFFIIFGVIAMTLIQRLTRALRS
ncbi:MAG: hypothetical protein RI563_10930, partial [Thiohalophilus sp.]